MPEHIASKTPSVINELDDLGANELCSRIPMICPNGVDSIYIVDPMYISKFPELYLYISTNRSPIDIPSKNWWNDSAIVSVAVSFFGVSPSANPTITECDATLISRM
ncbi:hypothetical protein AYI68_g2988 [Smittium mucronatum]|uniref:Uncharacterized protein n=1 Tax=Smittium mucronatum TaxID=133383 RepID=A0A1R0H175_9FUNG|nr:hypothetical protein AYI68_g2988 [Smittium mucronatum]